MNPSATPKLTMTAKNANTTTHPIREPSGRGSLT
jgi:hypothetical protein